MNILMLKFSMEKLAKILNEEKERQENLEREKKESETSEPVSMESFNMLSLAYEAKCKECNLLKKANRELNEKLSKYRYFFECQKNEIEKL